MQPASALLVLSLLCPSLAFAGEIRGTITEGGRSVGQGVAVDIRCGQKSYSATTDKYGSYRAFIPLSDLTLSPNPHVIISHP